MKNQLGALSSVARFFSQKTVVLRQQCVEKLPVLHSNPPKIRRQNSIRLKCAPRPSCNPFLSILLPSKFYLFAVIFISFSYLFTLYLHFFFRNLLFITCRSYGGGGGWDYGPAEVDRYSAVQFIYKKNLPNPRKPILCNPPNRCNPPMACFNSPIQISNRRFGVNPPHLATLALSSNVMTIAMLVL